MKNETKIFNTCKCDLTKRSAKYSIFQPGSLPFYTTIASNSYIPPTFSLENVFHYMLNNKLYTYDESFVKGELFSSFDVPRSSTTSLYTFEISLDFNCKLFLYWKHL